MRFLTGLSFIATTFLFGTCQAFADPVVLRLNRWVPPTHHLQTRILEPWASKISEATQGRVKIEFTTSSLGAPARQFDLAVTGVADITVGNHDYTPHRFALTSVAQLPFMTTSAEALSVALWKVHEKRLAARNEHAGAKVLSLFVHGPGQIFLGSKPADKIAGLKGLKLRTIGQLTSDIATAVDAKPISAPATQAYELLSNGVADGTFFHADGVYSFKLERITKTELSVPGGFYTATFFLVANDAAWAKIDAADQKRIMDLSGLTLAKEAGRIWDDQDKIARQALRSAGMKNVEVEGAELEALKARLKPVEDAWIAEASKKDPAAKSLIEDIKKEVAAYHPGG
jgi:TRAP-type C4-dicarboxylate transport system substrate-binding protein